MGKQIKIGVISDTHDTGYGKQLIELAETVFKDFDLIFHAGDLTNIQVLDVLLDRKVYAVCGNMDTCSVSSCLPVKEIVDILGYRIGLMHGWGSPKGIEDRIRENFEDVDAIIYGHTHKCANHIINGVLMFNPGAFSGNNPTYGILTIDELNGIHGETFAW